MTGLNDLTGGNGDTAGAAFADAVRQALAPHAAAYDGPAGRALAWSDAHWQAVAELGLPKLLAPEAQGGAGASLADGAAAIEALGALGDPSPAADTAVLAWLLARQGEPVPDDPLVPAEPGCRIQWPENARAVDPAGNAAVAAGRAGQHPAERRPGFGGAARRERRRYAPPAGHGGGPRDADRRCGGRSAGNDRRLCPRTPPVRPAARPLPGRAAAYRRRRGRGRRSGADGARRLR